MNSFLRRPFFFVFIFICSSLTAKDYDFEYRSFFFELWRYEYTGVSDYSGIEKYSGVSKVPAFIMAGTKWTLRRGASRIVDFFMQDYIGVFDVSILYDEASDDGDLIDSIDFVEPDIFTVEEPEELNEIRKEIFEKTAAAKNEIRESRFTDTEKKLRFYSFNDEVLSLQKNQDGYTAISSDNKTAVRKFYDNAFRLYKREFWNLSGGTETSEAAKTENYIYADGAKPVSAVITEPKKRMEISYDESGRIIISKVFAAENESSEKSADSNAAVEIKFNLKSMTRFSYGESGKLTERYYESYDYRRGKLTDTETKREVYEHKTEDGEPDYYFYENGALRIKRIYGGVDTYTAYMYFDGGYSSETVYENGKRVWDLFFFHDKLVRSRNYE
ncbi:MAG: hypothetical protein ACTTHU_05565 [Treponema sp.]